MLTNLGKMLRVLRIEEGESMRDMAAKLDLSLSYLSAIENGKRNVPSNFEDLVLSHYDLSEEKKAQLKKAVNEAKESLKVNFSDVDSKRKEVLLALASDELDDDTVELLCTVIRERKK